MVTPSTLKQLQGIVVIALGNPNTRTIVLDMNPNGTIYCMVFREGWNALRGMIEEKRSLTAVLLAGGPVEPEEPELELPAQEGPEEDFFEGLDLGPKEEK
jgi:hypothetical protein